MKVPQSANQKRSFFIPGRCVSFGPQVPRGLLLIFEGSLAEPIEVEPLSRYNRPFDSFELVFPNKVNTEDLSLVVHDLEYHQRREPVSTSWVVAQGSENMLSGQTYEFDLPEVGFKAGGAHKAAKLRGVCEANNTGNLPSFFVMEYDRNSILRNMQTARFSNAVGACFAPLYDVNYPLGGGVIRIVNGALARSLEYQLWATLG